MRNILRKKIVFISILLSLFSYKSYSQKAIGSYYGNQNIYDLTGILVSNEWITLSYRIYRSPDASGEDEKDCIPNGLDENTGTKKAHYYTIDFTITNNSSYKIKSDQASSLWININIEEWNSGAFFVCSGMLNTDDFGTGINNLTLQPKQTINRVATTGAWFIDSSPPIITNWFLKGLYYYELGDGTFSTNSLIVYEHLNFGGASKTLASNWSVFGASDSWNDKISSIQVPAGYAIVVYEQSNFKGKSRILSSDWSVADATDWWNDRISSIKILNQADLSNFNALISKADNYFNSGDYSTAMQYYKDAQNIIPGEEYAEQQIEICKQSIQDQQSIDEQNAIATEYNSLINDYDRFIENQDYESALTTLNALLVLAKKHFPEDVTYLEEQINNIKTIDTTENENESESDIANCNCDEEELLVNAGGKYKDPSSGQILTAKTCLCLSKPENANSECKCAEDEVAMPTGSVVTSSNGDNISTWVCNCIKIGNYNNPVNSAHCDKVLDDFDNYVTNMINTTNSALSGNLSDMDAMLQQAENMAQQSESISTGFLDCADILTPEQQARLDAIMAKINNLNLNINVNIPPPPKHTISSGYNTNDIQKGNYNSASYGSGNNTNKNSGATMKKTNLGSATLKNP